MSEPIKKRPVRILKRVPYGVVSFQHPADKTTRVVDTGTLGLRNPGERASLPIATEAQRKDLATLVVLGYVEFVAAGDEKPFPFLPEEVAPVLHARGFKAPESLLGVDALGLTFLAADHRRAIRTWQEEQAATKDADDAKPRRRQKKPAAAEE